MKRMGAATAIGAALIAFAAPAVAKAPAPVPEGFISLFDGKTLNGWRGDMTLWSVRDGAITGGSEQLIDKNTYLILEREFPNFELRFKYRFANDFGNSGIQFRSGQVPGNFAMAGMQANVTPITKDIDRFAMLYDELGDRQEMVLLGQRAEVTRIQSGGGGTGRIVRNVIEMVNPREVILKAVKPTGEAWNEGVVIVHGNRVVQAVNGYLAIDATINDPLSPRDGLIGLQLHISKPSYVQFKDVVIKPIDSFPDITGRFISNPVPAPEPRRTYKESTRVKTPDTPLPE
ncbi:DUF1080 domain-containing protein [Sphingomonas flavalba]|uniref:3-keto-disaccharide hydrolase n=1 Tax=Sphingomonas flavalba TaxID=2559804 RepID=UPI0039DFF07C